MKDTKAKAPTASMNGQAGQSQEQPTFELVTVTPAMAAQWLENNPSNRPISRVVTGRYAAAIRRGDWVFNGDSIRFDADGQLLDGQHRLRAVIDADTAITTGVVRGLAPETQQTMDQGMRRTFAQVLQMRGFGNAATLAAVTNHMFRYERYLEERVTMLDKYAPPTIQQSLAFFEPRSSGLLWAAGEGRSVAEAVTGGNNSRFGTAWYIFHGLSSEDCEDFFYKLRKGASLEEEHPVYALRRYLANDFQARRIGSRPNGLSQFAVIIKAWNAYRRGEPLKQVRWRAGGSAPEAFPIAE